MFRYHKLTPVSKTNTYISVDNNRLTCVHPCSVLPCPAQEPVSRSRRSPERFSLPERRSKVSNFMITELCFSRIFKLKKGSFHTKRFRRICPSVFRYRLIKNCFAGSESVRGFKGTSPRSYDDSYNYSVCKDSHAVS